MTQYEGYGSQPAYNDYYATHPYNPQDYGTPDSQQLSSHRQQPAYDYYDEDGRRTSRLAPAHSRFGRSYSSSGRALTHSRGRSAHRHRRNSEDGPRSRSRRARKILDKTRISRSKGREIGATVLGGAAGGLIGREVGKRTRLGTAGQWGGALVGALLANAAENQHKQTKSFESPAMQRQFEKAKRERRATPDPYRPASRRRSTRGASRGYDFNDEENVGYR